MLDKGALNANSVLFVQSELSNILVRLRQELAFLSETVDDSARRNEHIAAGRSAGTVVRLRDTAEELDAIIGWIDNNK